MEFLHLFAKVEDSTLSNHSCYHNQWRQKMCNITTIRKKQTIKTTLAKQQVNSAIIVCLRIRKDGLLLFMYLEFAWTREPLFVAIFNIQNSIFIILIIP